MTLIDNFGRHINYLRISVTDRCDFRCVYCMPEEMTFLPRAQLLTLEEMAFIGEAFVDLGVTKIRITGGEPLVRQNVVTLFEHLGRLPALKELTLTTNGSQLADKAQGLFDAGVSRINVSLDTLKPDLFRELTRHGDLSKVLKGIHTAKSVGFQHLKLNSVILKNRNANEVIDLIHFVLDNEFDISFIEEMPLGNIEHHDRKEEFVSSQQLRDQISEKFDLISSEQVTGGPSRYWEIKGYPSRIGFISPHSENFCSTCNRVRLSAEGRLLLCLGNEHSVNLKAVVRAHPGDKERLKQVIIDAMKIKPEKHHFNHDNEPQVLRFMNATGG